MTKYHELSPSSIDSGIKKRKLGTIWSKPAFSGFAIVLQAPASGLYLILQAQKWSFHVGSMMKWEVRGGTYIYMYVFFTDF